MLSNRSIGFIVLSALVFFGAAFVTLRAAERATQAVAPPPVAQFAPRPASQQALPTAAQLDVHPASQSGRQQAARSAATTKQAHPAPGAPEESATIADDPTTAPDPSQSADNNVSFPNDI